MYGFFYAFKTNKKAPLCGNSCQFGFKNQTLSLPPVRSKNNLDVFFRRAGAALLSHLCI